MDKLSPVAEFTASSDVKPCYIGRGRISESTVDILDDHEIADRIAKTFQKLGVTPKRPVIVWDPHIGHFIDTTPDVRGGFTEMSHDPKFPKRKVQTPQEIENLIRNFKGGHFIVPFAISGENLPERFTQMLDLFELIASESQGDYTLDVILTKPYGDRNDKDHKREGFKIYNAKSIASIARTLKDAYKVNRVYMVEPHSFNAMRLVQEFFNGKAQFPSLAPEVSQKVLDHLQMIGLGQTFSMDDVCILPPDGGLKHLIGSARYLAYMTAHGHMVPKPQQYHKKPFKQINTAYDDSLAYYRANPDVPFDYDRNDGPQASVERAWQVYCFVKGKPSCDVPLLLEDFPQDFPLCDKVRKNDTTIDRLVFVHGNIKGKILVPVDDISATGSTMVACAHEAYKAGAQTFIPVLMHGGFVEFVSEENRAKFDNTDNGLHYMLTRKQPLDKTQPLFPIVMFSKSAPSAEDYRTKLLADHPELHDRVGLIDVAETIAECVIDSLLQEQYQIGNPDLALLKLPEISISEEYPLVLKNEDQPEPDFRPQVG